MIGLAAALTAWNLDDEPAGVTTNDGQDQQTTVDGTGPDPTPTAVPTSDQPAPDSAALDSSQRSFAVEAWIGSEYLVWSGEAATTGGGLLEDGWRYDPATDTTRDIPAAPIRARGNATGVWTGTELLVCCGIKDLGTESSAGAYDPATDRWRTLTPPPADTEGYTVGAAWTGTEMLVVVQVGNPATEAFQAQRAALYAYDPAVDTWSARATPPAGDRFGEVAWTGQRLVVWAVEGVGSDRGIAYDPATNQWTELPELPSDAPVNRGSIAFADGQIVVWGSNARDKTKAIGYRLRLGDAGWRPMASAPLPQIEWYEGTPESQTLVADPASARVIVSPVTGYESGVGGAPGTPPNLLAYDPALDEWSVIRQLDEALYAPELTVGGGQVFQPNRDDPVLADL